MRFERPVGFSNGYAELTLKKPPPLVPSSLIASCEATGPRARSATVPPSVCTTPWETSRMRADDRDRQQHVERRAHEVLPEVAEPGLALRRAMMPRMSAMATAMPIAADTKFCTASPAIWLK